MDRLERAVRGVKGVGGTRTTRDVRDSRADLRTVAVLSAWRAEMDAFYAASARGDVSSRELLGLGVVSGSPEDEQMVSYLSAQGASGVVGTSSWRFGNMRVVSLGSSKAVVTACSYDTGSHLRSSGLPAPASLGGGAGFSAYSSEMVETGGAWRLDRSVTSPVANASSAGPCHRFGARALPGRVPVAGTTIAATSAATPHDLVLTARNGGRNGGSGGGNGGGAGSSGSSIWSWAWWLGSPQGSGADTGGASGGADVCDWLDAGSSLGNLDSALIDAGLPASFWTAPQDGGEPGIWAVDLWGAALLRQAASSDHFDLVACPGPEQVPANGGDVESDIPPATTPTGKVMYLWVYWDTVPNPSASGLPPLINTALAKAKLPSPVISVSPSSIDAFADATVVNFPTWLWIDASGWKTVRAVATSGGLVATVWATPVKVTWQAAWDFPEPEDDPEGGVTLLPENLDLVCAGPGISYDSSVSPAAQASACETVFTQSTFGTFQRLEASIDWQVRWELSNDAGVVGGEGRLADSVTSGTRPLRVLQVESVIAQG